MDRPQRSGTPFSGRSGLGSGVRTGPGLSGCLPLQVTGPSHQGTAGALPAPTPRPRPRGSASRCTSRGRWPSPSRSGLPHSRPGAAGPGSRALPGPVGTGPGAGGEARVPRLGHEETGGAGPHPHFLVLFPPPSGSAGGKPHPHIKRGGASWGRLTWKQGGQAGRDYPRAGGLVLGQGPQLVIRGTRAAPAHTRGEWACPVTAACAVSAQTQTGPQTRGTARLCPCTRGASTGARTGGGMRGAAVGGEVRVSELPQEQ